MIQFADWWVLLFILPLVALFWLVNGKRRGLRFSSVKLLRRERKTGVAKYWIGKFLILSGTVLLIGALARPRTELDIGPVQRRGIDIAMIMDVSGSMQSVDFKPNRMESARNTTDEFISKRGGDRICLIVFAGEAFTRVPLTLDHGIVRESLAQVTTESVNTDGTAIGMAISVGVNRLKKSDAASRVMILLTDGDNNAGDIDPMTASGLARELGIRIYTIGVGSDTSIYPYTDLFGRTQYQQVDGGFDEKLLEDIAETTGGRYYRAKNPKALSSIYETINRLERTDFDDGSFKEYNDLAFLFIKAALVLLLAGIFLDKFYFVQVP